MFGLHHIVLTVYNLKESARFYSKLFDTEIQISDDSFDLSHINLPIFFVETDLSDEKFFNENRIEDVPTIA